MQEMLKTQVQSMGQEDPLGKEMATHSSILAWKIPRTEEPGVLQPMGSQRMGHDWATEHACTWTSQNSLKFSFRYSPFLCVAFLNETDVWDSNISLDVGVSSMKFWKLGDREATWALKYIWTAFIGCTTQADAKYHWLNGADVEEQILWEITMLSRCFPSLLKAPSDLPQPFPNPQQLALQLNGKQHYHSTWYTVFNSLLQTSLVYFTAILWGSQGYRCDPVLEAVCPSILLKVM